MKVRRIPLLLGFLCSACSLQAATEIEGSIPVELAEVFLGLSDEGEGGLYSDFPTDFPMINLPDGISLMGSVVRAQFQTVYLQADLQEEEARQVVTSAYNHAGWRKVPSPFPVNSVQRGFTRGEPAYQAPLELCKENQPGLNITSQARANYGTIIVLNSHRVPFDRQSCDARIESRQQGAALRVNRTSPLVELLPRLLLPESGDYGGRRPGPTGGISTRGDEASTSTHLKIDWSLAEIREHFGEQIEAQDWAAAGSWATDLVAGSNWTKSVEEGGEALGLLSVVDLNEGEFELEFRILTR